MKKLLPILGTMMLAACVAPEDPAAAPDASLPTLATDQSAPKLALMDYMLGNYFASDVARRPTVCASMHDGRSEVAMDAADELALMTRYDALAPFSRCAWLEDGWQDGETGEPAIIFNVHSFTCANDDQCSGFGAYVAGQTSSLSNRYTMEYTGGAWQFVRDSRLVGEE